MFERHIMLSFYRLFDCVFLEILLLKFLGGLEIPDSVT